MARVQSKRGDTGSNLSCYPAPKRICIVVCAGSCARYARSLCHRAPQRQRIVFYDFPPGRVWWRRHWAERMAAHLSGDSEKILKTMDETNYKLLAEKLYPGKSYPGATGLLLFPDKEPVIR